MLGAADSEAPTRFRARWQSDEQTRLDLVDHGLHLAGGALKSIGAEGRWGTLRKMAGTLPQRARVARRNSSRRRSSETPSMKTEKEQPGTG